MLTGRQFATFVLVLLLLFGAACKKKKPQLPKQAQAPTIPISLPDKISEATPPPVATKPTNEEPAPPPVKPKSQPRRRRKTTPPAVTPPATIGTSTGNTTIAAAHPPAEPAADTAIAADISREQATQQKQTTAQLLDAAEKNLKTLPATLSSDQKAMVEQIKAYINQSHLATDDKDLERAYNLAQKARLLSDALVKK